MEYSHRYRAYPSDEVAAELEHQLDVHRQLYNHVRWDYENSPEDDKPSEYAQNNNLPEWKQRWPIFGELHSKAAQATVARFHQNLSSLRKKNEKGHNVGRLKRQAPADYRSVTYNQSGFDLDEKRDHDTYASVRFSKVGWVKIRYSRSIPDHATIKELTVKKAPTGEWFVSFGLETDDEHTPAKPDVDSLDASNSVGIDLGIRNYIHASDGKTMTSSPARTPGFPQPHVRGRAGPDTDGGNIPPRGRTPVRARYVSPARGVADSASNRTRYLLAQRPTTVVGLAPAVLGRGRTGRAIGLPALSATVGRLKCRRGWIGRAVTPSRFPGAGVL